MQFQEGFSAVSLIFFILGVILFFVSLALLIRAALKTNEYPIQLVSCLIVSGAFIGVPLSGKFDAPNLLKSIGTLTEEVKKDPGNDVKKKELDKKIQKTDSWIGKSPATISKLEEARVALRRAP